MGQTRRSFVGAAAAAIAAAKAGLTPATAATDTSSHMNLGPIKQIDAGVLNVGYAEAGPPTGPPVILLHGWPYDIHSYVDVAPLLAAKGYRVIVPYLRGYGTTRFRSTDTFRNGQQSVVALDIIALMDALKIPKAIIGGFDWGSRTAAIMAALWPERCKALVAVSGYLITNLEAQPQAAAAESRAGMVVPVLLRHRPRRAGYRENRHDFNKLIWTLASPKWDFDEATYDRTAAAFDNPDHVAIVIHNYRWRLEPREGRAAIRRTRAASCSRAGHHRADDHDRQRLRRCGRRRKGVRNKFSGKYSHRVLSGIGHNVPQEAPQEFAKAVADADAMAT